MNNDTMNDVLNDVLNDAINAITDAELIEAIQGYHRSDGKWKTTKKKKVSKKKIHQEVLYV